MINTLLRITHLYKDSCFISIRINPSLRPVQESMFVSALSVAQTGDFLCTGGHSSTIHVWDIASRSIKARIKVGGHLCVGCEALKFSKMCSPLSYDCKSCVRPQQILRGQ